MKFHARHGVHDHEKQEGNSFEVDVIFEGDLSKAGKNDRLTDAIDYTIVHKITAEVMHGESADLIEHLCYKIGEKILAEFSSEFSFVVKVRKLNPPLSSPTHYTEAEMTWPR